MSTPRLTEIREDDATLEIAALYADIRRCMRLPLVNLIYRHLATLPGVLPEVWSRVRTMMLSGRLEAAMGRLLRELPVIEVADFRATADTAIERDDRHAVERVLQAYNRGNSLNLIALVAVRLMAREPGRDFVRIAKDPPSYEGLQLPALKNFSDLDAKMSQQITSIALLHGGGRRVVPSLYLHLANWPNVLATVCDGLRPRLQDGSVDRCREAAVGLADREAKCILADLAIDGHAPPIPEQALTVIERFVAYVIPEMLPVGIALKAALL